MPLISPLKNVIYRWQVRRKLKKRQFSRYFTGLDEADDIAITFIAHNFGAVEKITDWRSRIQQKGKKVEVLGYIPDKTAGNFKVRFPDIQFLTAKELTWWYVPKTVYARKFMNKKFDLLLNVYQSSCPPLEYISALAAAKLRVGAYRGDESLNYNDFLVDLPEENNLDKLIKQIEHYLNPTKDQSHVST